MNAKMERLASSFHGLSKAEGVQPFDPELLDAWATGPAPGSGALNAARFVLAVWNSRVEWRCGRLDVTDALCCWDADHREAFLAWAREPWWP